MPPIWRGKHRGRRVHNPYRWRHRSSAIGFGQECPASSQLLSRTRRRRACAHDDGIYPVLTVPKPTISASASLDGRTGMVHLRPPKPDVRFGRALARPCRSSSGVLFSCIVSSRPCWPQRRAPLWRRRRSDRPRLLRRTRRSTRLTKRSVQRAVRPCCRSGDSRGRCGPCGPHGRRTAAQPGCPRPG
jgi:hypothetical protein